MRDDRHAALDPPTPEAGGEHRHAVDIIQDAVAIRPDQCQIASGLDEIALQRHALAAHFGKPGRVADGATGAHRGQLANHVDGQFAGDGDEGGVGRYRKIAQRLVTAMAADLGVCWIDRPYFPGEPGIDAVADGGRQALATDEGNMTRRQ